MKQFTITFRTADYPYHTLDDYREYWTTEIELAARTAENIVVKVKDVPNPVKFDVHVTVDSRDFRSVEHARNAVKKAVRLAHPEIGVQ